MKKIIWISIGIVSVVGVGFILYLQNKKPIAVKDPSIETNNPNAIKPAENANPAPTPPATTNTLITPKMSVKEIQDLVEAKGLAVHIESDIKRKGTYKTKGSKDAVQRDIDAQLARLTELGYLLLPNGEVKKI